jgi:modulator of FtsH protease
MQKGIHTINRSATGLVIQTNSVIRNTYILLSMTLLFSALTAWFSMAIQASPMGLGSLIIYFGLFYAVNALRNSVWGIAAVFALTGFLGYTLGPLLNTVVHGYVNGAQLVSTAFGLTGLIFFILSGYALTTRKDFNYMGGFLFAASMVVFIASIVGVLFSIPMLYLIATAGFVLISSGLILFETSRIINGGERNYIMATVSLFVALFNLFVSLLQLLMVFAGRKE